MFPNPPNSSKSAGSLAEFDPQAVRAIPADLRRRSAGYLSAPAAAQKPHFCSGQDPRRSLDLHSRTPFCAGRRHLFLHASLCCCGCEKQQGCSNLHGAHVSTLFTIFTSAALTRSRSRTLRATIGKNEHYFAADKSTACGVICPLLVAPSYPAGWPWRILTLVRSWRNW